MRSDIDKIRKLVGDVTTEQLRYVDCFVGEDVGLFMPVGGPCYYGILPDHTHPAYMFTLPFNDQTFVDIGGKTIQARRGMIFALSPGIVHHELPSDYPPRVRGFLSVFFDGDDGIYFTTVATKKVYKQLSINPKVELCYLSPTRMLRITGQVEFVCDLAKKQELINKQFYLKGFSADSPDFILMRLPHGKAHFWTLADNLKENDIEVIEF